MGWRRLVRRCPARPIATREARGRRRTPARAHRQAQAREPAPVEAGLELELELERGPGLERAPGPGQEPGLDPGLGPAAEAAAVMVRDPAAVPEPRAPSASTYRASRCPVSRRTIPHRWGRDRTCP